MEAMKALKVMSPLPLVIALVLLKCSIKNLQFPHRVVPFYTKEKMPWCPCPEAYRPVVFLNDVFCNLFPLQVSYQKCSTAA